ncbi:M20/M25/M40 family metallo-hydrolase [Bremerella cremea]|uniref:M20/M25/M40 family metallo-hydrolase n=1 Tax=Bremerella cremea TaxID=1031537 RepID=A0A368KJ08_9BACT|nr:M20/M25/M40 family metallo-hydrolase [Bremerella cremea]RCS40556.1 M20/M25/M40 family metallo-hydrolase [Bremerella cremea]
MLSPTQQKRALELVQTLMAIPGKSGEEAEVAVFVREQLLSSGVPASAMQHDTAHTRCPVPDSTTGNLIVHLPGNRNAPRRMLMAHMDTVPICVGSRPTRTEDYLVPQDKHTGLGADDRAGVATVLFAATELLQQNLPHGPLTLLFTVQEEIGLQGARHLEIAQLGEPELAFNWDGSDPVKLTVGAIGGYRMTIDIHGKASHAGVAPQKGISAVTIAGVAIAKLHQAGLLGKIDLGDLQGTSNIGVIQGGNATNVVADHVRLQAEVRSHNKETIQTLVQRFEQAFHEATQEVTNDQGEQATVKFDGDLNYEPFVMPTESPNVTIASGVLKSLGLEPVHAIANGGLDANWMFRHGIPTVSLGCGQQNPHMTSERLNIPQFHTACEIALRIATGEDGAS